MSDCDICGRSEEYCDACGTCHFCLIQDKLNIEAEIARLKEDNGKFKAAAKAFLSLMNESQGVYGLHLNGDPAPWEELEAGGRFEEWLYPLSEVPPMGDHKDMLLRQASQRRKTLRHNGMLNPLFTKQPEELVVEEVEKLCQRVAELEQSISDAYEIYAGMEGFNPQTAPEGYCQRIIEEMASLLAVALGSFTD